MSKLTIQCISRQREKDVPVMLTSLLGQSFKDWDLLFLQEGDTDYTKNRHVMEILRRIKNAGHRTILYTVNRILGCPESFITLANDTNSPYAMKIDDDHLLESDVLSRFVEVLDKNPNVGMVGGMIPPLDRELYSFPRIPSDFNKWTGKSGKIWNDYTTLTLKFPETIVEVDFLRSPFMYRADYLKEKGFYDEYLSYGYSPYGLRMESEITNYFRKEYDLKTMIHTGAFLWHFMAPEGGHRVSSYDMLKEDDENYYGRWGEMHSLRAKTEPAVISAITAIYNEPPEIVKRCLDSLEGVVDDYIFLVHSKYRYSTKGLSAIGKVIRKDLDDSVVEMWRNMMMEQAKGEWILVIDPDEYLDEDAKSFLQRLKRYEVDAILGTFAFAIRRKNFEIDENGVKHEMRNYPDMQLRLFRKGMAKYPGEAHIAPEIVGNKAELLEGHLIHDKLHATPKEIQRKVDLFEKFKK